MTTRTHWHAVMPDGGYSFGPSTAFADDPTLPDDYPVDQVTVTDGDRASAVTVRTTVGALRVRLARHRALASERRAGGQHAAVNGHLS